MDRLQPPRALTEARRVIGNMLVIPLELLVVPLVVLRTVVEIVEQFGTQPNVITPLPVAVNLPTMLRLLQNLP